MKKVIVIGCPGSGKSTSFEPNGDVLEGNVYAFKLGMNLAIETLSERE